MQKKQGVISVKLIILGILIPLVGLGISIVIKKLFSNWKQYRVVDGLPPFLIAGIQLISLGKSGLSIIEVVILGILILALGLSGFLALRNHELLLPNFFKILWRLIFILSFGWYILLFVITGVTLLLNL